MFGWWSKGLSTSQLIQLEGKILSNIKSAVQTFDIEIDGSNDECVKIHTIKVSAGNCTEDNVPVVALHGFVSGVCLWTLNLDAISYNRDVYAIDLLGFGCSSRVDFFSSVQQIIDQYIDSIEKWRKRIHIEEFILMGHSFGGFLALNYSLLHPIRVKHLILIDPWGLSQPPLASIPSNPLSLFPLWARLCMQFLYLFAPLSVFRAAGPFGPSLLRYFLPRIPSKFSALIPERDLIIKYIYHINAQKPSGEKAFQRLSCDPLYLYAQKPCIDFIDKIAPHIGMDIIYGSKSVLDRMVGDQIKLIRNKSYVKTHLFKNAGHNIHIDAPNEFNELVVNLCRSHFND